MPHAIQTSNSHISVKNSRQNLGIVAKRRISCYYIQANPAAAHQQEMKKISEKKREKNPSQKPQIQTTISQSKMVAWTSELSQKGTEIVLHSTGFEPAHTNIFELESNPLDQLGHKCVRKCSGSTFIKSCMIYLCHLFVILVVWRLGGDGGITAILLGCYKNGSARVLLVGLLK